MGRSKGSKTPRVDKWSFWWPCERCDKVMEFLVNEPEDQEKVYARCPKCSSLLEVTDSHRKGRQDRAS